MMKKAFFPVSCLVFACLLGFFTVHNASAAGPRNHMDEEFSPYLQFHSEDPVHWRPWTEETLQEAQELGRPILLSIGYLACHWCHVMQKESYGVEETAAYINSNFLPILVDREEMPELDASFQSAASVLGLPGGWPLTMFLTPEGKPFWGGTYFPSDSIAGMPSFTYVMERMVNVFETEADEVRKNARAVAMALGRLSLARPGDVTMEKIDTAANSYAVKVNPFTGGFGNAPLFPMAPAQENIWRAYLRTGTEDYRDAVALTLDAMGRGGIYDHVGGGFFRYTVDPEWNIPHFEKMLDVNSSMLRLMTEVWRETRNEQLKRHIYGTISFLLFELRLPGGAFASARDADSLSTETGEEEEGAYYTWTPPELQRVLGNQYDFFSQAFEIAPIPDPMTDEEDPDAPGALFRHEESTAEIASRLGRKPVVIEAMLDAALDTLLKSRNARPSPRRDGKVLADWNAMAITSLTEAGMAFGESNWVSAAETSFRFIVRNLIDDKGRLRHSWVAAPKGLEGIKDGGLGITAGIDDLAGMAGAALTLYEATGNAAYRDKAIDWLEEAFRFHWEEADGGFFATPEDSGPQLSRSKPIFDSPNMSGNARMIDVLARLFYLSGNADYLKRADRTLKAFGGLTDETPLAIAGFLNAAETLLSSLQVVVIGDRRDEGTTALLDEIAAQSLPNRILQVVMPGTVLPDGHPAQHKTQIENMPTAYVCKGSFCSLPSTEPEELRDTLKVLRLGNI